MFLLFLSIADIPEVLYNKRKKHGGISMPVSHTVHRLSDFTREFCERSLNGQYGRALAGDYCALVDPEGYDQLSPAQRYNRCLQAIVEQAPIRLIDGELLSGSATFDLARNHMVPAALRGDPERAALFRSKSHLTPHYQKILKRGIRGLEEEIAASRVRFGGRFPKQDKLEYLNQLEITIGHMKSWHRRYLDAIGEKIDATAGEVKTRWQTIHRILTRVPYEPARNFREAIQSLWFTFVFQRQTGNWAAVGRFDWMLGPYLKQDLAQGTITLGEARELVAHFWIKGCEWIDAYTCIGHDDGGGDGQFYQNVVLSGTDAEGNDETNEVTYLVLDVLEELRIADYPTSVRLSSKSPEKLIRRVAEVTQLGGGLMAVYNDDAVIPGLVDFGYCLEDAVCYANDGCWEVQIPGKTAFRYWPWDVLAELQRDILKLGDGLPSDLPYETFDQLFDAYVEHLKQRFKAHTERCRPENTVNLAMSLLVEDCIGNAADYGALRGSGALYQVDSPHAGGIVDAANALQAIQYVVYDQKLMSLNGFIDIVKNDWVGHEDLRLRLRSQLVYYGNGDKNGDAMMQRLFDAYVSKVCYRKFYNGTLFPAGISTFGRQVTDEFLDNRYANPDGHKKGEFLSNNISPTPGTDIQGATATLRSYGGLDMKKLPGGTALEIKMSHATVRGQDGVEGIMDLLYAFCQLGCHFMQLDVVDAAMLKKAQEDPENYGNLVVRVSGWSSRFRTLEEQWQRLVIERTEMGF